MKIYNQDLSKILTKEEIDQTKGKLVASVLQASIEKNGQPILEDEKILVFVPYTDEEIKEKLRFERQMQCFEIINRGEIFWTYLWNRYTQEEVITKKQELINWYYAWLNVTDTKVIPNKPEWLN